MFNAMLENMLNLDTEIIYYVPEMFYSIVFKFIVGHLTFQPIDYIFRRHAVIRSTRRKWLNCLGNFIFCCEIRVARLFKNQVCLFYLIIYLTTM